MKKCIYCASEIPEKAIFCKECNHFQTKRRWLSASSTVLALIVALVSVIGVVAPAFVEIWSKDYSAVSVRAQNLSGDSVYAETGNADAGYQSYFKPRYLISLELVFHNSGTLPGYIESTEVTLYLNGEKANLGKLNIEGLIGRVIKPGEFELKKATLMTDPNSVLPSNFDTYEESVSPFREDEHHVSIDSAHIVSRIVHFDLTRSIQTINFPGDELHFQIVNVEESEL